MVPGDVGNVRVRSVLQNEEGSRAPLDCDLDVSCDGLSGRLTGWDREEKELVWLLRVLAGLAGLEPDDVAAVGLGVANPPNVVERDVEHGLAAGGGHDRGLAHRELQDPVASFGGRLSGYTHVVHRL